MASLFDIQGDIWPGLPKRVETFWFFTIEKDDEFRKKLQILATTLITSGAQAFIDLKSIDAWNTFQKNLPMADRKDKVVGGINVAFTSKGLAKMKITGDSGDTFFKNGMQADQKLLDPKWDDKFTKDIHGVFLLTGDSDATVGQGSKQVQDLFLVGQSTAIIKEVLKINGKVREGANKGFEHFGFNDGLSEPAIIGFDDVFDEKYSQKIAKNFEDPKEKVGQSVILLGSQLSWTKDGSFLCFRQLEQKVPEFKKFLKDTEKSLSKSSDLLGARLIGRWKSGAPVIGPQDTKPDPDLGFPNNFTYGTNSPGKCPWAAHTQKTYPRDGDKDKKHRILRRGIPYGKELSDAENNGGKTLDPDGRGLLFVCYQSSLRDGFHFIQEFWANNADFPFSKNPAPGLDPIIGQSGDPKNLTMSGLNPDATAGSQPLSTWVVPKGGEYFFSPSIPVLSAWSTTSNMLPPAVKSLL